MPYYFCALCLEMFVCGLYSATRVLKRKQIKSESVDQTTIAKIHNSNKPQYQLPIDLQGELVNEFKLLNLPGDPHSTCLSGQSQYFNTFKLPPRIGNNLSRSNNDFAATTGRR